MPHIGHSVITPLAPDGATLYMRKGLLCLSSVPRARIDLLASAGDWPRIQDEGPKVKTVVFAVLPRGRKSAVRAIPEPARQR